MGCATGVVKYLVFLANMIFALAGLGLVIIGVLFKFNIREAQSVFPTDFGIAPILSIVIGAIVFITAFLGCCGAVKESPCMLTSYSIILLTIFIIQLAIGIYVYLKLNDGHSVRQVIRDNVQRAFDNRHKYPDNETMAVLQSWLHCCGVSGPDDYPGDKIPVSCCKHQEQCPSFNNPVYHDGCAEKVFQEVENKSKPIAGVAIGIAVLEIVGAIFGLCLASSIRNQYNRRMYA